MSNELSIDDVKRAFGGSISSCKKIVVVPTPFLKSRLATRTRTKMSEAFEPSLMQSSLVCTLPVFGGVMSPDCRNAGREARSLRAESANIFRVE